MTCRWCIALSVIFQMFLHTDSWAAGNSDLDPRQVYSKRTSWAETMLATRANCAAWARSAKEGEVASTPLATVRCIGAPVARSDFRGPEE